ncbi:hypothetical protein FPCIR_2348 [Fusarium pseudocircinatum]|uniref:Transcription factor domain-containing protein n=1 Tax=Fusarium pseudocircinatum TaxID=56676 RepID=A0A8H5PQ98_9HYPO|nr:hypothetical protein FPCIR_2348 [Fusarium pseudocircinatum]
MSEFLYFSHLDREQDGQNQRVAQYDTISRRNTHENTSQRRERKHAHDGNINLNISDVQTKVVATAGPGNLRSTQHTWLNSICANSLSRVSPSLLDPFDTLSILMVISYEYRVRDTYPGNACAATHMRGLQTIISQPNILARQYSVSHVTQVQRALFWQDIICSLATGAPRLLQFDNREIFTRLREDETYRSYFTLPQGFIPHSHGWPAEVFAVFEDLNALCCIVDTIRQGTGTSISLVDNANEDTLANPVPLMEDFDDEEYPLCNSQAELQIRLVDLLSTAGRVGSQSEEALIYRACLFAAYLCTYRLSEGVWGGYFAPEMCVTKIFDCMTDLTRQISPWKLAPDITFWLLYIAGGLTKSQVHEKQAAALVERYRCSYSAGYDRDWELVEMRLKKFIWSGYVMKPKMYNFWQESQTDF